jgi:hypothetical protein
MDTKVRRLQTARSDADYGFNQIKVKLRSTEIVFHVLLIFCGLILKIKTRRCGKFNNLQDLHTMDVFRTDIRGSGVISLWLYKENNKLRE